MMEKRRQQRIAWLCVVFFFFAGVCNALAQDTGQQVEFGTDIAPILESRCIQCHYAGLAKGDIALDSEADLREAEYVVPGKPEASYLLDLVTPVDGQAEMPADGDPLTEQQVNLLRRWIAQGAKWPARVRIAAKPEADLSWWSLQPLAEPQVPTTTSNWAIGAIDQYVLAKLNDNGLAPNPRADRSTLIRRATYDLTGLPPTPQEVDEFIADPRPDAYARLIDRLLESPHYGERWGRHWLDVVRFGESTGYERNIIIDDAWPFRDYVIDSFNADKPLNTFIQEHIAGDVLGDEPDPRKVIGSAFLVNGPYDNVGNQDAIQQAQIRANTIDEMIRTTSEAFLGLTVGCARCHDHKFDPIRQSDYYRLYATFAGVKHGSHTWARRDEIHHYNQARKPLLERQSKLTARKQEIQSSIESRSNNNTDGLVQSWTRPAVDRQGTSESFEPVKAKFVRFICEARDDAFERSAGFRIDEFEVWEADGNELAGSVDESVAVPQTASNIALASQGAVARGASRVIEDFPGAYGPQLTIDGAFGARFISASNQLEIEFAEPSWIEGVRFSSARLEPKPEQPKFTFVAEYRVEVSLDGESWQVIADGSDREPINEAHRSWRLAQATEPTIEERQELADIEQELREVRSEIAKVASPPTAWIGSRDQAAAQGPFHIFLGGNPQKLGDSVLPGSLSVLERLLPDYELDALKTEAKRRLAFAKWVTDDANALTARVLVNRIWQNHFGIGIVSTANDFGYMGQQPSHPKLLDYLAGRLLANEWRTKELHREIMLSATYQQSSDEVEEAIGVDADSRYLWRFPPRRLSAEEIRDSMLSVAGCLDESLGGPGFRLYRYLQDNVATYVPLDKHGPETYRRAVYHQNARASVVDLMTDFDQPDCAFSTSRRTQTTTPLQALTALNHSFTLDMARRMSDRLRAEADQDPVSLAFRLCYAREPSQQELAETDEFLAEYSLASLCRVLLNTSEFLYVH